MFDLYYPYCTLSTAGQHETTCPNYAPSYVTSTISPTETLHIYLGPKQIEIDALRAQLARAEAERDAMKSIVVDLCSKQNCYPEELVEIIEREYEQGTECADEVIALTAERDRYKAALEQIAEGIRCDGPDCFFCDEGDGHPSSDEAMIAQEALTPWNDLPDLPEPPTP